MQYEQLTFKLDVQDNASSKFDALGKSIKGIGTQADEAGNTIRDGLSGARIASVGRDLLRFSQVGVDALKGLATAASNVTEAQNFAQQIFQDSTPIVEEYSKTAAQAVGMSQTMALQSAASLGIFGKSVGYAGEGLADFSTSLVDLAADMASVKNTTPEAAITAVGAAFRSQYRPIKEYGVVLNETVLKQAAYNAGIYDGTGKLTQAQKVQAVYIELFKQLGFAQGDFQRTSEQMANQQRILNAEFENAKASLGEALKPAFVEAMKAAGDLLAIITDLPDPIKEIGAVAGIAVVSIAALGGGLLFVGGKVLSAVQTFGKLKAAMQASDGMAGSLGGTLGTLGKIAGIAAVEMLAIEAASKGINAISGEAKKGAESFDDFAIAMGKAQPEKALAAFSSMAEHSDKTLKGFLGLGGIIEDAGRSFGIGAGKYRANIEDWDRAFNKILTKSPDDAAGLIDALRSSSEGLDKNSQQYKDTMDMIDRYEPKLKKTIDAQLAMGDATTASSRTLERYADKALLPAADNTADLMAETADMADEMDKLTEHLQDAEGAFKTIGERAKVFQDVLGDATGVDKAVTGAADVRGAIQGVMDAFKDEDGNMVAFNTALDSTTEAGRTSVGAMDQLAQSIQGELVRAYEDSNGSAVKTIQTANKYTDELRWQMAQAGYTTDEINAYIDQLNLTPEDVVTTIKLEKQQEAMQKLDLLKLNMDQIPPDIATEIIADVDRGDYIAAYNTAKGYITSQGVITVPTDAGDIPRSELDATKGKAQSYFNASPIQAKWTLAPNPQGGVGTRTYGPPAPGYGGNAYVPAESAAMMAMGLSTSPGGSLYAAPPPAAAGHTAPMSTPSIVNVSISMPMGTNEVRVVDMIRQYARSNGTRNIGGPSRR
jgi:hypothetical protein